MVEPIPMAEVRRRVPPAVLLMVVLLGGLAIDLVAAPLVAFAAECITRGVDPAIAWVDAEKTPPSFIATAIFLFLCIRGLQALVSRPLAIGATLAGTCLIAYGGQIKVEKLGTPLSASDLLIIDQLLPTAGMLWGPWIPAIVTGAGAVAIIGAVVAQARRRAGKAPLARAIRGFDAVCAAVALALVFVPDYGGGDPRPYTHVFPSKLLTLGIENVRYAPMANLDRNGQLLVFLFELRGIIVDRGSSLLPPRDYDEEGVRRILTVPPPAEIVPAAQAMDVVVIQSEAWWNPELLPGVTFDDPMFGALDATAHGTLYSPTFGGFTVNAEFEVLTRLSTAFLTQGSIPFQQYVHRPLPSLVADFAAAGYDTTGIHPFDGTFWNRNVVYPRLGFRRFLTQTDFVAPDLVSPYISDMALANKIIATLDATPSRKFIYAVSMQNHAPYANLAWRYDGRTRVGVHGDKLDAPSADTLSTYASGARDAVLSFNAVVEHMRAAGRPALVVMLGDHLPYLGDYYDPYVRTGFVSSAFSAEWTQNDYRRMHDVPVVGWSNLPQGVSFAAGTRSLVFLGTDIKRAAGVPMSPIDAVLARVAQERPVLTADGPEGRSLAASQGKGAIADYRMLEFDLLSGRGYALCTLRPALCDASAAGPAKEKGRAASK